jgi:hypothetical protein
MKAPSDNNYLFSVGTDNIENKKLRISSINSNEKI